MTVINHYGQMRSERLAEENKVAREIVREIGNFGVNERQRWLIIYQLALELENIDDLKALTTFVKERKSDAIFIADKDVDDG